MELVKLFWASLVVCVGFAVTIFLGLVKDEVSAWLPVLARRIIQRAAAKLKEREDVDRYLEEWLAHLQECPGRLGQLFHALGVWQGAARMSKARHPQTLRIDVKRMLVATSIILAATIMELFSIKYDGVPWPILILYAVQIAGALVAIICAAKMLMKGRKYIEL